MKKIKNHFLIARIPSYLLAVKLKKKPQFGILKTATLRTCLERLPEISV